MKDLWFPILVLLGIITVALTGGAKNYQQSTAATSTANNPLINATDTTPTTNSSPSNAETISANPQPTPVVNKVSMEFGSYGTTDPNQEYVEIDADSGNNGPIDISGWTLHSKWSGQSVTIPQSVDLYFTDSQNSTQDVYLSPGERAYVITGRSPIGYGMHVNICSGYLSQYNPNTNQQVQFTPGMYTSCPVARNEDLSSIPHTVNNANCFTLIDSLGSCQTGPTLNNTYSYECQQFIETKLNYQSCVDTHKNDSNFYSPDEWYVYLNRDQIMWMNSQYEDVVLMNQSGTVMAEVKG